MSRRIGATGLTTISSVSNTRSTMMPKVLVPTWVTTMIGLAGSSLRLAELQQLAAG